MFHGGECWMSDPNHPNYEAGIRATKLVYGVEPDMTREGGSIPVTLTLEVCIFLSVKRIIKTKCFLTLHIKF